MLEQAKIVGNLEKARRLAFPDFEKITLSPAAVKILVHLFIHPGCKSDINLVKFLTGQPVLLSDISPHIITAFPSQVALYAKRRDKTVLTDVDLLECFAIDHAEAVEENKLSVGMAPSYALAHMLTIGKIMSIKKFDIRQLAEIAITICKQKVNFSHALVPSDVLVGVDSLVFHHFGVVVAVADSVGMKSLARNLQSQQNKQSFLQKITRQVVGANVNSIDYAKESFFKVDMTGKLIQESKKDLDFHKLWQEEDLKKIKIPKEAKVMFQS